MGRRAAFPGHNRVVRVAILGPLEVHDDSGALIAVVTGETLAMAVGPGTSGVWWDVDAGMLILGAVTIRALVRNGPATAAVGLR